MFRHKINPPMLRSAFLIKINNIKDRSLHTPIAEAVISFYLIPADEALTILPSVWTTYSHVLSQRAHPQPPTRQRTRMIHSPFDSCWLLHPWRNSEDTDMEETHTHSRSTSITNVRGRNRQRSVWWRDCRQADKGKKIIRHTRTAAFHSKLFVTLDQLFFFKI